MNNHVSKLIQIMVCSKCILIFSERKIDVEKIQNDIDTLLVFMNDDLENQGMTIKQAYFDFTEGAGDFVSLPKRRLE